MGYIDTFLGFSLDEIPYLHVLFDQSVTCL